MNDRAVCKAIAAMEERKRRKRNAELSARLEGATPETAWAALLSELRSLRPYGRRERAEVCGEARGHAAARINFAKGRAVC